MNFKFKVKILVVHGASECERIGNSGLSVCTNESMLLSLYIYVCVCAFVCMYIFGLYDKPVWHVSLSKRERERAKRDSSRAKREGTIRNDSQTEEQTDKESEQSVKQRGRGSQRKAQPKEELVKQKKFVK